MPLLPWADRALGRTSDVLAAIAGIALVTMMFQVTSDVVMKYLFARPIAGTLDVVSYYYMVGLTFLPLAAVERDRAHISVELLSQVLPRAWQARFAVLSDAVSVIFFGALAYANGEIALAKFRIGEYAMGSLALPIWPSRFLAPLGFALIAAVCALKVVQVAARAGGGRG